MPRLKSRDTQIPNGLRMYIAPLKWSPPTYASFDTIVRGAIAVLQGNPEVAKNLGWDLSYESMADRVDEFNSTICEKMGWWDYVTSEGGAGPGVPFYPPSNSPLRSLRNVAAGGEVLVDWIASGSEAVPVQQAESRAGVCVTCPYNQPGNFLRWFTVPVSEAIRRTLEKAKSMKLSTSQDDKLGTCKICLCPLKLKLWLPLERIRNGLTPEIIEALPGDWCWIVKEAKA